MASEQVRVLFCDDEPRILSGLRRQLRTQSATWHMRFAESGREAIRLLEEAPADVVVADMRMPGMDGGTFLKIVRDRWPETVRFVLSGQTDQGSLLEHVGAIHQFLQKPVAASVIIHAVNRSMDLANALRQTDLHAVVSGMGSLPVLSSTCSEVSTATQDPEATTQYVAAIIANDVGLSAKVLQLVNSSFFGMPRRVSSIKEAVALIGMERIRVVALSSNIMDTLASAGDTAPLIKRLWNASLEIGRSSAQFAARDGRSATVQEVARLSGLLSLVGRAILLRERPHEFMKALDLARQSRIGLSAAESVVFGVPQQAIGAYTLGLWAFDDDVVEAVARQATPDLSRCEANLHPAWYVNMARCQRFDDDLVDTLEAGSESSSRLQVFESGPEQQNGAA